MPFIIIIFFPLPLTHFFSSCVIAIVMYKISYLGKTSVLPPLAKAIFDGQLENVKKFSEEELCQELRVVDRQCLRPLELAIHCKQPHIIKWLCTERPHSVKACSPFPLLSAAVRFISDEDQLRFFIKNFLSYCGSATSLPATYCPDLYNSVHHGRNYGALPVLDSYGASIKKYGGALLRSTCAFDPLNECEAIIDSLIQGGADVNYNASDNVFSMGGTPLLICVSFGRDELARTLVTKYGADVRISDDVGDRPLLSAYRKGNTELEAFMKEKENWSAKKEAEQLEMLRGYGVPDKLIDFLSSCERPKLQVGKEGEITFFPAVYVPLFMWKYARSTAEHKKCATETPLLVLSSDVHDYSDVMVVFIVPEKRIGFVDIEHGTCHSVASWESFSANPAAYYEKYFDGEFDSSEEEEEGEGEKEEEDQHKANQPCKKC